MKNKKGFTLIELLVVLSIISLLATLSFTSLQNARLKARDTQRLSDLKQVRSALEVYYNDYGYYPTLASGSTCPTNGWSELTTTLENGGYISDVPTDPTNSGSNIYMYCSDTRVGETEYTLEGGAQEFILRALLENSDHDALDNDQDGTFFTSWSGDDNSCADPYYCVSICRYWSGHEGTGDVSAGANCGTY